MTAANGEGLPPRQRGVAVLALSLGVCVSVLVGSLVNVALPAMARELHVSDSAAVWLIDAYQLAVTVMLLPMAALGERRGLRPVYLAGVALFVLSSLAAVFVHSLAPLLALRVLQGVGAAGIMAVNTALLRACYPASQLGRGLGINGMVVAASAAAGPSLAAVLLTLGPWPILFAVQAAVALAVLLAWRSLPRPPARGGAFDGVGAVLQGLTIVLALAAVEQSHRGGGLVSALLLVTAVALGVVFVRLQRRQSDPLLPLDLLRQPVVSLALITAVGVFVAQMAAQVALPFHLHQLLGWGPQRIGLLMTPWPLAVMCVAPLAGALSDRVPAGLLGGSGLLLSALALALLAWLPVDAQPLDVAWRMALAGAGFALFTAPNLRSVIAATPQNRSGAAGGLIAMARLVGQTGGASLVAWLLGAGLAAGASRGVATTTATATFWALVVAAVVSLIAAFSSAWRLRARSG